MAIEEAQQHIIVSNLIIAIEQALLQQTTAVDTVSLASGACNKLRFDFPCCSTSELQALSEELCRSTAPPRHLQLSRKIFTNVFEGAAVLVGPQKHDGVKLTTGSATPDHSPATAASVDDDSAANPSPTHPHIMQQAYSQLAATVLISLFGKALAHPQEVGWQLVCQLGTDRVSPALPGGATSSSTPNSTSATAPPPTSNISSLDKDISLIETLPSTLPAPTAHTSHPAIEAEDSDDDDFVFEDIEPASSNHATHQALPHTQHHPTRQDISPYSADELLHTLLWLSSHVSYSLLGAAAVFDWQDGPAPSQQPQSLTNSSNTQPTPSQTLRTPPASAVLSPALLQVLSACVCATFESASLLAILHPYITLISDAVAEHPQCVATLHQLWAILAPSGTSDQPITKKKQATQGMQTFPGPALELASGLCSRVVVPAAKAELWRQVHAQLLSPLLRHLQQLTRATAALTRTPAASMEQCTSSMSSQEWSSGLEAIQQTCPLVSFYLRQAPRNAQPAQQLLDAGLIGPLVLMWVRLGFLPPAEPLRMAVLLAASGSPAVLRWMLAVPGFVDALRCNVMCEGGVVEEHGCVWQLLLSDLAGSLPTSKGSSGSAAGINDALAATGRPDRAERLLLAAAAAVEQPAISSATDTPVQASSALSSARAAGQPACHDALQALGCAHALLQLLASACELSPRTASMLTFPLAPALKQLETALRSSHGSCSVNSSAQDSSASTTDFTPAASSATDARAEMVEGGVVLGESVPADDGDVLKDHAAESEGVQSSRHSKGMLQLRSSAMKLIKTLLTSQGKTD